MCWNASLKLDSEPYGKAEGQHMAADCSMLIYSILSSPSISLYTGGGDRVRVLYFELLCPFAGKWDSNTVHMLKLILVFSIMVGVKCREIFILILGSMGSKLLGLEIQSVNSNYGPCNRNVTLSQPNEILLADLACQCKLLMGTNQPVPWKQEAYCLTVNTMR